MLRSHSAGDPHAFQNHAGRSSNYSFAILLFRARQELVTRRAVPRECRLDSRVPRAAFLTPQEPGQPSGFPWHLKEVPVFPLWWKDWGVGASLTLPAPADAAFPLPPGVLPFPLHAQTRSTYLCSLVPLGSAGRGSSAVVIALLREGPGWGGPSSSERKTPHGCLQTGDTSSGCPSPEQAPRCSRVPGWQPTGGSPTSTMPTVPKACAQKAKGVSCSAGGYKRWRQSPTERHLLAS